MKKMTYVFQESQMWERSDMRDPDGAVVPIRARSEKKARKKLPVPYEGQRWALIEVIPVCNCGSLYTLDDRVIHYQECDVIQHDLGHI